MSTDYYKIFLSLPGQHPEIDMDHTISINCKENTLWELKGFFESFIFEISVKQVNVNAHIDTVKVQITSSIWFCVLSLWFSLRFHFMNLSFYSGTDKCCLGIWVLQTPLSRWYEIDVIADTVTPFSKASAPADLFLTFTSSLFDNLLKYYSFSTINTSDKSILTVSFEICSLVSSLHMKNESWQNIFSICLIKK